MTDLETMPFPPPMLIGIAAGLEPAEEVAARFGYAPDEYRALAKTRAFQQALAKVAQNMDATGLSPDLIELSLLQEMSAKVTKKVFSMLTSDSLEPGDVSKLAALLYRREEALSERMRKQTQGEADTASEQFVINISLPENLSAQPTIQAAKNTDTAAIKIDFSAPAEPASTLPVLDHDALEDLAVEEVPAR